MQCPECRLENPPTSIHCDCGYNFERGRSEISAESADDIRRTLRRVNWISLFWWPLAVVVRLAFDLSLHSKNPALYPLLLTLSYALKAGVVFYGLVLFHAGWVFKTNRVVWLLCFVPFFWPVAWFLLNRWGKKALEKAVVA